MPTTEEAFRRLALGDTAFLADPGAHGANGLVARRLDERTEALLRIAALIAVDAPESSYRSSVEAAVRGGARLEDLLAVLVSVSGAVGSARVVAAAPRIAMALGYDVEAALQ
jgi:alkylhydroperoxidase/carboxymuconolactone decarboxylase family protein YurZ